MTREDHDLVARIHLSVLGWIDFGIAVPMAQHNLHVMATLELTDSLARWAWGGRSLIVSP